MIERTFISAHPGFFVLSTNNSVVAGRVVCEAHKSPVIGWMIELEADSNQRVFPVTIYGVDNDDPHILLPNGTVERPVAYDGFVSVDEWLESRQEYEQEKWDEEKREWQEHRKEMEKKKAIPPERG